MESLELLKAAFLSRLGPSGFKDPFSDGYFLQPKDSTPSSEGEDRNGLPFDCFFTFDFYSRLLGLLEMNENAIEVKSPLQIYTDSLFVYLLAKELLEKDEMAVKQCDSKMDEEEAIPHDDNAIFVWKRIKGVIDKLKVLRTIQEEDQHEEEEEEEDEEEQEEEEEVHAHDHDKKGKEKLETCDEATVECDVEKEKVEPSYFDAHMRLSTYIFYLLIPSDISTISFISRIWPLSNRSHDECTYIGLYM